MLYAIENGGFSGAYMPQNVVVGQDAIDVAKFVATYAGRQAPQSGRRQTVSAAADRHAAARLGHDPGRVRVELQLDHDELDQHRRAQQGQDR